MIRNISRRAFLRPLALLPGLLVACRSTKSTHPPTPVTTSTATPTPAAASPAQAFIVTAGAQQRMLLAGEDAQTPLYIFGSGRTGKVVMALGGEEGNEPAGWLAGDRLVELFSNASPLQNGAVIILPRANQGAIALFQRTTAALGDLNRLYPGDPAGLPIARLAAEIVAVLKEFQVDVLVDMHESWAFYNNRPENGTAHLGQTITASPADAGGPLARSVVDAENSRMQAAEEEFFYRAWGAPTDNPSLPVQPPVETFGARGTNSLNLPRYVPGLVVLLVEMGQQQPTDRRIAMHVDVFLEVARHSGVSA